MKKPHQGTDLTPAQKRRLREIEYDFHVRAFSEEMARINFLPEAERKRELGEMIDHAWRESLAPGPGRDAAGRYCGIAASSRINRCGLAGPAGMVSRTVMVRRLPATELAISRVSLADQSARSALTSTE